MIRYALKCSNDHAFESWFASARAFDRLAGDDMVACPVCGSAEVVKSLMAPSVVAGDRAAAPVSRARPSAASEGVAPVPGPDTAHPLSAPQSPAERALAALRRHVETTSEYVGQNFATEARAIHDGAAPERSIFGEARIDEARALIEEGVPVAPLPFRPARKTN